MFPRRCFWGLAVLIVCISDASLASVQSKVRCSKDLMEVDIVRSSPDARIYLQQLKEYPDEACKPRLSDGVATFSLALDEKNMSRCGIARVVNKVTGQKVYYHRIVVEEPSESTKHTFTVKCIVTEVVIEPEMEMTLNHTVSRRSVNLAGFQPSETIDLGEIPGSTPVPSLGVGVRQGDALLTGELTVSPGTPLQMEIFLDQQTSPVYGVFVTHMQATGTKDKKETIIYDGCSLDPYLFENFKTADGDVLKAKFRAFKFPESTYVQFRGTVNVCLGNCPAVECPNGRVGFGRKRRAISMSPAETNVVFEVTISTFIKVDFGSDAVVDDVQSKVRCSKDLMEVDIVRSSPDAKIYLQQLKEYPDEACKPKLSVGVATFSLSLDEKNMSRCGVARVVNKMTGQKVYYHRIVIEEPSGSTKQTFTAKCIVTENDIEPEMKMALNHTASRRSVLPAGFQEAETIDLGEIAGSAPVPNLGVGVRQGGTLVTGELNVSPGTPLQMEIFLDERSSPIYGLLVTYMQVTDTKNQEETIIFNGCSVDPYLFENFNTVDGDFLTAKFRAFKFPESTYVQFRGTVNVCLDKCQGIECSNGHIGFGRKRRAISMSPAETNKVFEVTMSTFIKVDGDGDAVVDEALSEFIRRGKNRTGERSVIGEEVREQFIYKEELFSKDDTNAANVATAWNYLLAFVCLLKFF